MKQRTYYNSEPEAFDRAKFSATLRLDIREEAATGEDETATQYSALEFMIFLPITQNRFIEQIFTELYGNDYEAKLINEYNAAQMGLYPDDGTKAAKIQRYRDFLAERAATKRQIEDICATNGIA